MHKRTLLLLAIVLSFSLMVGAQTAPASTSSVPTKQDEQAAKDAAKDAKDKAKAEKKAKEHAKKDQEKKEREEKKARKDKNGSDPVDTSGVFNERIANDVLGQIRDGLEGHSRRLMLSAFDSDKMDGYLSFEDQIDAFFERYEAFRVRFRISNVTVEGTKGVVLVDTEMEETPRGGAAPQRKRSQLRFELELGRKGWRIVDFRDRGFFS
ncbi:MAG TPA: hypothetical protein VMZ25_10205 [Terriglobales bacterium]|nr:hypothetical protein [Terriglobales bacterium]